MKSFTILLLSAVTISQISAQGPVPGRLIWSSQPRHTPLAFASYSDIPPPVGAVIPLATACAAPNAGSLKAFCTEPAATICDALGFNLCTATPRTITCPDSEPYCVQSSDTAGDAKCSATPPVATPACAPKSTFDCTQNGILPDPKNCRQFYNCYKTDPADTVFLAQAYECPTSYAFDPSLPDATPCRYIGTNNALCITSNCIDGNLDLQTLRYPYLSAALGQIGVRCLGAAADKPLVFRCGAYSTLSAQNFFPDCILTCRTEGQKAPYNKDNTKYYQCFRTATGLTPLLQSCYYGYFFDAAKLACVLSPVPPTTSTTTTTTVAPGR